MRHAARTVGASIALGAVLMLVSSGAAFADWPVYGHDLDNSRNAGAEGPPAGAVPSLKQAWRFDAPTGDFTGTPVVAGGVLVAGDNGGHVYALDAATGRVRWSKDVGAPVNGSAAIDLGASGGAAAYVPVAQSGRPHLLALSLADGATRWDTVLTDQPNASVFGSPVPWDGSVYIGTSGPNNDDSTARGSVVALDQASGNVRWQTFTVPPGHDGAAVWSTPAIDAAAGRLYVGTGNNYHPPTTDTEDAILALDLGGGQIVGRFQATSDDSFSLPGNPAGPDLDFGSSPNLIRGPSGERFVGEGQKSGVYWAVDRATMQPQWHATVGPGSPVGGLLGSTAYDGTHVYGADTVSGQVFALSRGGSLAWQSADVGGVHWSPTTVANGVLYTVEPDGVLTARDPATGSILAKLPLGGASFGGVSAAGGAVYAAVGTGPPPAPLPQQDGSGAIVAFGDTSAGAGGGASFAGRCHFAGRVTFSPPLRGEPQAVDQAARAEGTCSGTFADGGGRSHALDRAHVVYAATEHGDGASCAGGTDAGRGTLRFAVGRLRFAISEERATSVVHATLSGADGGSATAIVTPGPATDPATVAKKCAGTGVRRADVGIDLQTSPAIAG